MQKIGKSFELPFEEYDITQGLKNPLNFETNDLVVIGIPVYAGRVPALAAKTLQNIKGKQTPVILVCVYGNRDYDDALLELKNNCENNGFTPIAASAFIARHSIFPSIAANRPDERDDKQIVDFVKRCMLEHKENAQRLLHVKGNYPYKIPSAIPLFPKGNRSCTACGICVKRCPVSAIPEKTPRKTNKEMCISCARCIAVCPEKARNFSGLIYRIARRKFESAYKNRKEPEFFFPE